MGKYHDIGYYSKTKIDNNKIQKLFNKYLLNFQIEVYSKYYNNSLRGNVNIGGRYPNMYLQNRFKNLLCSKDFYILLRDNPLSMDCIIQL